MANTLASDSLALVGSFIPPGVIMPYAGSTAPSGWLLCDGAAVSQTTYAALYAAIASAWGNPGGGSFNLPDLIGRFLRGKDSGTSRDPDSASRTASATGGNAGANVGSVQVEKTGVHGHGITDPTHGHAVQYNATGVAVGDAYDPASGPYPASSPIYSRNTILFARYMATGVTVNNSTGSESRPINANVNYIIKF